MTMICISSSDHADSLGPNLLEITLPCCAFTASDLGRQAVGEDLVYLLLHSLHGKRQAAGRQAFPDFHKEMTPLGCLGAVKPHCNHAEAFARFLCGFARAPTSRDRNFLVVGAKGGAKCTTTPTPQHWLRPPPPSKCRGPPPPNLYSA